MKIRLILPILILGLLLLLVFAYSQRSTILSLPETITPTPTSVVVPTQPVTPIYPPVTITASEANIKVFSPRTTDNVGESFTVSGDARVFENTLQVRVTNDETKEVLFNQLVMADAQDTGQFGPYSVVVELPASNLRSGDDLLLEVFQFSAKDGSEIDKVLVPLIF